MRPGVRGLQGRTWPAGGRPVALLIDARIPWIVELVDALTSEGIAVVLADTYSVPMWGDGERRVPFLRLPSPVADPAAWNHEVSRWCETLGVTLVLAAHESAMFIDALGSAEAPIPAPEGVAVRRLHDKAEIPVMAERLGILTPEVLVVGENGAPVVVRPRFGRGGEGADRMMMTAQSSGVDTSQWVMTRFVDGHDLSSFSVALDGRVTTHVAYRHILDEEHDGSVAIEATCPDASFRVAEAVARAHRFTGFFGLDFRQSPDQQLWLLECNPRLTVGVLLCLRDVAAALRGQVRGVVRAGTVAVMSREEMRRRTRGWHPIDDISFDGPKER